MCPGTDRALQLDLWPTRPPSRAREAPLTGQAAPSTGCAAGRFLNVDHKAFIWCRARATLQHARRMDRGDDGEAGTGTTSP